MHIILLLSWVVSVFVGYVSFVGTSTGEILTFTLAADPASSEQNKFVIGKTLQNSKSTAPITDLCSVENDGRLVSADENGAIVIWENSSMSVLCSCNFEE